MRMILQRFTGVDITTGCCKLYLYVVSAGWSSERCRWLHFGNQYGQTALYCDANDKGYLQIFFLKPPLH